MKEIKSIKKGNYLKNMDSDKKILFLSKFDDEVLKDVLECAEHVLARRNGKECHLADF